MGVSGVVGLGDEVEDRVTGFTGTVTAIVDYLDGVPRAYVQPLMTDYGCVPQELFVEVGRLELKKAKKLSSVS